MDQIEVGEGSFRACGGLNLELANIQSPRDQNTLTLKGFQISQISEIGGEFTRESCLQNGVAAYTKLFDKAEMMLNKVFNLSAHQRISAISHTLCYGKNGLGESIQRSQSLDLHTGFSKCIRENDSLPLLPEKLTSTEHHEARKASDYYQALYHACIARRIFITCTGQFGLAPSSVKSGDLVVILFGGRVPFVLRSKEDGEDNYELIGHCFMSDLMHGEAANGRTASGQDAETLKLK